MIIDKKNKLQTYLNISFILFSASLFIGIAPTNITYYMLLLGFLIKNIKNKTNPFKYKELNYIIFGFFIVLQLVNLFHLEFYSMFEFLRQFVKIFLIFIIVDTIKEKKVLKIGLFTAITVACLSVIFSLISLYTGWEFLSRLVNENLIVGFGADWHISYACKLGLFFIFNFVYFMSKFNKIDLKYKFLLTVQLLILITGIFYSGSRGVILALIFSLIILCFFKIKFNKIILIIFIFGIALGTTAYFTSPHIKNRFNLKSFESSADFRAGNWMRVINKWEYFVFGFGTDNYEKAMDSAGIIKNRLPCHIHNNILQYFIEYGFVGIIMFFCFWISILWYIFKLNNKNQLNWIVLAGIWSIFMFHIAGLTEANLFIATTQFSISYIIGLIFISLKIKLNIK